MYQADFICTYKLMDDEDDKNTLYQFQLLQAFDMIQWNDDRIYKEITAIYETMKTSSEFAELLLYAKKKLDTAELRTIIALAQGAEIEDIVIFQLLFQYDFFDLLHNCISEYLNNAALSQNTADKLGNII